MKKKLVNIMGFVVPVLLLITLSGSFVKSIKRARETEKLIEKTKSKVEKEKQENEELKKQLEFVQSDQFIEEQLRNKLGMAKEGEIVLVLPDNETLAKLAPDIEEEEESKPLPNWKKWMNLFM